MVNFSFGRIAWGLHQTRFSADLFVTIVELPNMESILAEIVRLVCETGSLPQLDPDQDFYEAGVSSVQSLPLLMQMEDRFNITIPDERFTKVRTARQLQALVSELMGISA
jgi:acyl carrier protein